MHKSTESPKGPRIKLDENGRMLPISKEEQEIHGERVLAALKEMKQIQDDHDDWGEALIM